MKEKEEMQKKIQKGKKDNLSSSLPHVNKKLVHVSPGKQDATTSKFRKMVEMERSDIVKSKIGEVSNSKIKHSPIGNYSFVREVTKGSAHGDFSWLLGLRNPSKPPSRYKR